MLHHPCILGDPQREGDKIKIGGAHKWAEMLHHPCILGDPQREGDKIKIGGAHKWAEMLHHPCILGDPQREGDKIKIGGAHKWAIMLHHQGGQNQNWMPKPCLLGGPQVGRNRAFSGVPSKENKVKTKKSKKKTFPWYPWSCLWSCRLTPLGFEPRIFKLQGTALPLG